MFDLLMVLTHEDEQERERMEARQREVLSSLGIER